MHTVAQSKPICNYKYPHFYVDKFLAMREYLFSGGENMTKQTAVQVAVKRVRETGFTFVVTRRGYKYNAQMLSYPVPRGWAVAEQIGVGNVHNYEEAA
jgi:hypothetical protein